MRLSLKQPGHNKPDVNTTGGKICYGNHVLSCGKKQKKHYFFLTCGKRKQRRKKLRSPLGNAWSIRDTKGEVGSNKLPYLLQTKENPSRRDVIARTDVVDNLFVS